MRRLLAHGVPVRGDVFEKLAQLWKEVVRLLNGEEPGEGGLHALEGLSLAAYG